MVVLIDFFCEFFERLCLELDRKQANQVASKFVHLSHFYTESLIKSNLQQRGIYFLREAIKRFAQSSDILTTMHGDFLILCLKSYNFKAALPILDQGIFDINPPLTGVLPRDMLLYFYYGGMIFTGLREYKRAQFFFENCIMMPCTAMSAIMAESAKKLVLVSCLARGKYEGLPKNASSIVQRHLKDYLEPYLEFSTLYATGDLEKCQSFLKILPSPQSSGESNSKGGSSNTGGYLVNAISKLGVSIGAVGSNGGSETAMDQFKKDKNFGLVKQCLRALSKTNIQKLTAIYLSMSLHDIAKTAKLATTTEAERVLMSMVEDGDLRATIDQANGIVSFMEVDGPNCNAAVHAYQGLNEKIKKVQELCNRLKRMDVDVSSSKSYVAKLLGIRDDAFDRGSKSGEFDQNTSGSFKNQKGSRFGGGMPIGFNGIEY